MLVPAARWRSHFVIVLVLAAVLGGCAREPERPDVPPAETGTDKPDAPALTAPAPPVNPFAEPARRALRIELRLEDYRTVEGTWAAGDATSTFTAYFAGDTLRFIEERMSLGEYGDETNVYYFADPRSESGAGSALFYAVQDAVYIRLGRAGGAQRDTLRLRVALAPTGEVIASEGTVNGEAEGIEDAVIEGVRSHVEALRARLSEESRLAL